MKQQTRSRLIIILQNNTKKTSKVIVNFSRDSAVSNVTSAGSTEGRPSPLLRQEPPQFPYFADYALPTNALVDQLTAAHLEELALDIKTKKHTATQNSKLIQSGHVDISFWNVNSFQNFYDLFSILNSDIFCLNETWIMKEPNLYNLFAKFKLFYSFGKKDHIKGRAKGGLMLIIKNLLNLLYYTTTTTGYLYWSLEKILLLLSGSFTLLQT